MFSLDQYEAARKASVVVDRALRGKIAVTGADRVSFLHALFTNDIAQVKRGVGVYSAYLTPQGRMISDMRVIETGDRLLLDVAGSVAGPLVERFDKLIFSEDVHVQNVTTTLGEIGVHGPAAGQVIERGIGVRVDGLTNQYDNTTEAEYTVVRDDSLGVLGFDIYVDGARAEAVRAKLRAAGAVEASEATAEVLRVEAGRPKFGVDMDTETIPLEAGIEDRAISLTKGCYVGQEVIVRVLHRGHGRVARRLVGLLLGDGSTPSTGDAVFSGDKEVGRVTSATPSPLMGAAIALAYVQREHASAGTELVVRSAQGASSAKVEPLPFSRR
jgi:folate-binding protein YgfZ